MKTMLLTTAAALAAATLATASVQAQDGSARPGWRAERGDAVRAHDRGGRHGYHHGRGDRRGHGRDMMRQFQTFDADGDGRITQAEIDQFRQNQITRFDADRNGTLSLEEYQALWLDAMRERMVDAFQEHDDDGDGQVTAEEFNERYTGLVERFDRNGDGVLSPEDRGMRRRGAAATQPGDPAPQVQPQGAPAGQDAPAGTGSQL